MVDDLDAFLDALLAFQCLALRPSASRNVVLFGNGGGTSVLGTDAFDRSGFTVPALGADAVEKLDALALPAGSTVTNPIDVPAGALQQKEGRVAEAILDAITAGGHADILVIHVNMTVILTFRHVDMLVRSPRSCLCKLEQRRRRPWHIVLVLRSDGEAEIEDRKRAYRRDAVAQGVAVYDELPQAARALACVRIVESYRERRSDGREASIIVG